MLPVTIEYKGSEWWVLEDNIVSIKEQQILSFDELSVDDLDDIFTQVQERRMMLETIEDDLLTLQEWKEHVASGHDKNGSRGKGQKKNGKGAWNAS